MLVNTTGLVNVFGGVAPAVPAIADINGGGAILDAEQNVTFQTDDFSGEITTFKLVSGSAETSLTGVNSSGGDGDADAPDVGAYSIDTVGCPFSHDSSDVSLGKTVLATLGDGTDTDTLEVMYKPDAGDECVRITNATQVAGSLFEDYSSAPTDLSQVLFEQGNGDGQFISVSATGIVNSDSAIDVPYQLHDEADDTWKQAIFLVVPDEDTTPDTFSFNDLTNQLRSDVLESNIEIITGIDASTAVSISTADGMEYRKNGGSYTAVAGTLVVNDTIQLRVTSSSSFSTLVNGTLIIGGVTDTWNVTTEAAPLPAVIDDINGDEVILDGEQNVTFATSNFAGEITTFKLISGSDELSATGVNSSGGDGDCDIRDVSAITVPTAGIPFSHDKDDNALTNSVLARLGDGAETKDLAVVYKPKAGWNAHDVSSAVKVRGAFFENIVEVIPNGSQIYAPEGFNFSSTGILTTDETVSSYAIWWNSATKIHTRIEILL